MKRPEDSGTVSYTHLDVYKRQVNDLDGVLNEFDHVIGLDRLKAVHFNDSMNDCGSHKDRHAKIGDGKIGAEAMRRVAYMCIRDRFSSVWYKTSALLTANS